MGTRTKGLSDPRASGKTSENQVHMEYIRGRQNPETQADHNELRRRINSLILGGSKAKMNSCSNATRPPRQPSSTLLNFGLTLAAACIIVASCTVKSAEAKPTLKQYKTTSTVGGETVEDLINEERNENLFRYLLEVKRLRDRSNKIRQEAASRQIPVQQNYKRANTNCLFHAGLAHNCDFRDVISAVNEMSYWGSDLAPGKKKRTQNL